MIPSLSSITSRLRFRHLGLLVALEECGSLHRAAERLGMTQPGLTTVSGKTFELRLTRGACSGTETFPTSAGDSPPAGASGKAR